MSKSPAPAAQDGIPAFADLAADPEVAPLLNFEPVVRKVKRPDGWTPDLQRELIARIAATGTLQAAVWQMGKHATGAESLYKTPDAASFRLSWDAAIIIGRRRNGLDSRPPYAGEVPGITRRRKDLAEPHNAPEETEPSDDAKWDVIVSIATKFMRKVAAERTARLSGQIVAADFYLRQITFLEVLLELSAERFGFNPRDALHELRRGRHPLTDIVSTELTDALDASRRLWWAQEGEPDRPPHPDVRFLEQWRSGEGSYATNTDQHSLGGCSTPARGYSPEQWSAMSIDAQRAARQQQFDDDAEQQRDWEAEAHEQAAERLAHRHSSPPVGEAG
jgi:hypothetical protein